MNTPQASNQTLSISTQRPLASQCESQFIEGRMTSVQFERYTGWSCVCSSSVIFENKHKKLMEKQATQNPGVKRAQGAFSTSRGLPVTDKDLKPGRAAAFLWRASPLSVMVSNRLSSLNHGVKYHPIFLFFHLIQLNCVLLRTDLQQT